MISYALPCYMQYRDIPGRIMMELGCYWRKQRAVFNRHFQIRMNKWEDSCLNNYLNSIVARLVYQPESLFYYTWRAPQMSFRGIMTSLNGNIFRVTGLLCGEFTGHRWIPRTKASDAELWWFVWFAPEPTVEQTMETLVIWDATALIMTSL